jgi:hypothetical protein
MKDKARQERGKGESYDYGKDFKVLTPIEKSGILKTAKTLLKVQKKTALLVEAPAPPVEAKKTDAAYKDGKWSC